VDLDIVRSLDKVGSGDGSIGNESGISTIPISEDSRERSGCDEKGVEMMIKSQSGKQDRVSFPTSIQIATPLQPRSDHE